MFRRKLHVVTLAAIAASLTLSACGSSSDSSTASGSSTADVAAAQGILAPYTGHPSTFPVDVPLAKRPEGDTFGFLQCVTPICGLMGQLAGPATEAVGAKLKLAKADGSATGLQSSLDALIESNPDAMLFPAVEPSSIKSQLATLDEKGIPTVSNGIMDADKYGIDAAMFNTKTAQLVGQIQAAWVVQKLEGKANPVFYTVPELSFTKVEGDAFTAEMKKLCPACDVRTKDISVTTIGGKAPSDIVSDLQGHPKNNAAVFSSMEMATGLPAAMKVASLDVDTVGFGPNPANLQDVKTGGLTAAIGLDVPVVIWTQVDIAARLATGQDLTAGEKAGIPPLQVLEQKDITFDPSNGWTGFPDFAQRFTKLWAGQG